MNLLAGRRALAAAHLLAGLALLLDVVAMVLLLPQGGSGQPIDPNTLGGFVLGATYPAVGWIIAARRPGNAVGWIFLAIGLSQALDTFASQYATVGLVVAPGVLPGADLLSWIAVWAWVPGFALLDTLSILLFPDGRLPSRRWRAIPWLTGLAMVLLAVPIALVAWPDRGVGLLDSGPVATTDPTVQAALTIQAGGLVLLAAMAVLSIAGMLLRFRRSVGVERAQLTWFVAAGVVEILSLIASAFFVLPSTLLGDVLTLVTSPLLPITATIAILRYRLYEIDRIVSRTVSYLLVTGILAAMFGVVVVALQAVLAVLAPFTRTNQVAIAGSTLVAAAAFQPLRRRVQRAVDRRFNRSRYDAAQIVAGFGTDLRSHVELRAVSVDLTTATRGALGPTSVGIWLRRAPE